MCIFTLSASKLSVISKFTSRPANELSPPLPVSPVRTETTSLGTELIISPISKNKLTRFSITESKILDKKSRLSPLSRLVSVADELPSSNEPYNAIEVGIFFNSKCILL